MYNVKVQLSIMHIALHVARLLSALCQTSNQAQ